MKPNEYELPARMQGSEGAAACRAAACPVRNIESYRAVGASRQMFVRKSQVFTRPDLIHPVRVLGGT